MLEWLLQEHMPCYSSTYHCMRTVTSKVTSLVEQTAHRVSKKRRAEQRAPSMFSRACFHGPLRGTRPTPVGQNASGLQALVVRAPIFGARSTGFRRTSAASPSEAAATWKGRRHTSTRRHVRRLVRGPCEEWKVRRWQCGDRAPQSSTRAPYLLRPRHRLLRLRQRAAAASTG
jgi:hypothetical protein